LKDSTSAGTIEITVGRCTLVRHLHIRRSVPQGAIHNEEEVHGQESEALEKVEETLQHQDAYGVYPVQTLGCCHAGLRTANKGHSRWWLSGTKWLAPAGVPAVHSRWLQPRGQLKIGRNHMAAKKSSKSLKKAKKLEPTKSMTVALKKR
jgi:hypothetical protein